MACQLGPLEVRPVHSTYPPLSINDSAEEFPFAENHTMQMESPVAADDGKVRCVVLGETSERWVSNLLESLKWEELTGSRCGSNTIA